MFPVVLIDACAATGVLFDVDFSLLSLGGHAAATFASQTAAQPRGKPLVFARTSVSTVQTAPDTVISGLAIDDAAIGSPDGTKVGLVLEAPVIQLISSTNSPRDLNDIGFGAWQAGGGAGSSVTSNAAVSPDGQTKASFCVVGFNGYSPYTVFGGRTEPFQWSIWRKSTNSCRQFFENYDSGVAASTEGFYDIGAGSAGWTRHTVVKPPGHFLPGVGGVTYAFGVAECQGGLSAGAPGGPAATSLYVDLMQLQMGTFPTECIEIGNDPRHADQLALTAGASIFQSDRLRFYAAFYPKFATTEDVWFNNLSNITLSGVMSKLYFWADNAGGTGAWFDRGANKLKIADAHSNVYTSTTAMSWGRDDFVEIFMECGNSVTTSAKYRVNDPGGTWIDLVDGTAMVGLTPSADITFFANGDAGHLGDDTGSMVCRLQRLAAFGAGGQPP